MRALFVKQDHASPSGLVGDAFAALGWDVSEMVVVPQSRFRSPNVPAVFPSAAGFDAVVFYGAPWSVYDTATIGAWITAEIAFARSSIALGVPVLGICFGGQMLAAALGGSVALAPIPEIGWIDVTPSAPGPIESGLVEAGLIEAGPWFAWHCDRFSLPAGVPVLARTDLALQAFAAGRVLGLQFHPEVTAEVLEVWLAAGGTEQLTELGIAVEPLLERTRRESGPAAARTEALVRRFVTDVARRAPLALPALTPLPPAAPVLEDPTGPALEDPTEDATVLTPPR
jgi:GMP synthase-like glutamine amidotransferase